MKISRLLLTAAAVAVAGAVTFAQAAKVPAQDAKTKAPGDKSEAAAARADIKGEGITGALELTERVQGTGTIVEITLTATGLKPGLHGVHLHAIGKCEPDFAAAGGHFDPGPAGNTDPDANHPFHMGDIPNLEVGPDGRGTMKATTSRVTLSDGPLSIFDTDGTAVIVHGNADQGITGEPKSGVSGGPRIACGVIQKK